MRFSSGPEPLSPAGNVRWVPVSHSGESGHLPPGSPQTSAAVAMPAGSWTLLEDLPELLLLEVSAPVSAS